MARKKWTPVARAALNKAQGRRYTRWQKAVQRADYWQAKFESLVLEVERNNQLQAEHQQARAASTMTLKDLNGSWATIAQLIRTARAEVPK